MNKLTFFLLMISASMFGKEKHPYQYSHNNGSIGFDITGLSFTAEDAKIMEIQEYYPACYDSNGAYIYDCGAPVLDAIYEQAIVGSSNIRINVLDIPSGVYSFRFKFAPQGNNIWCTSCSKARSLEIINDSKYICINSHE